jgi:hypothetical protein
MLTTGPFAALCYARRKVHLMTRMTKNEAERMVRSLAPGVPTAAVEWGTEMMLTISRARGGQSDVELDRAWAKALEVSSKPQAVLLLDAMNKVPPKPELLPTSWEQAVQPV